jgi:hypothetical protein
VVDARPVHDAPEVERRRVADREQRDELRDVEVRVDRVRVEPRGVHVERAHVERVHVDGVDVEAGVEIGQDEARVGLRRRRFVRDAADDREQGADERPQGHVAQTKHDVPSPQTKRMDRDDRSSYGSRRAPRAILDVSEEATNLTNRRTARM